MAARKFTDQLTTQEHKEMLERAATGAGFTWRWHNPPGGGLIMEITVNDQWREWNPLWSTKDATELAMHMKMDVVHNGPADNVLWVSALIKNTMNNAAEEFKVEHHRIPAYRFSVVRAAGYAVRDKAVE